MNRNKSYLPALIIVLLLWASISFCALILPKQTFSDTERRKLASCPEFSWNSYTSGTFASLFETYTLDQFPWRNEFRTVKSVTSTFIFGQSDMNGFYLEDGYLAKMEYPLNSSSIENAIDHFQAIYDIYLAGKGNRIYAAVVPDKGYYLGEKAHVLTMDYDVLFSQIQKGMSYAQYVDLTKVLDEESYYKTDTHWKQETLLPVAQRLAEAMNIGFSKDYDVKTLEIPFFGVYYGQAALPLPGEELSYLTNSTLEQCIVTNVENLDCNTIYDMEKAAGRDPYEMFLSGATPLITIENPSGNQDRQLVLFRDSFGSSLAPLLVGEYGKITLVDIRYINTSLLGEYVDFSNSDVLFLYSTLILNSSNTLK